MSPQREKELNGAKQQSIDQKSNSFAIKNTLPTIIKIARAENFSDPSLNFLNKNWDKLSNFISKGDLDGLRDYVAKNTQSKTVQLDMDHLLKQHGIKIARKYWVAKGNFLSNEAGKAYAEGNMKKFRDVIEQFKLNITYYVSSGVTEAIFFSQTETVALKESKSMHPGMDKKEFIKQFRRSFTTMAKSVGLKIAAPKAIKIDNFNQQMVTAQTQMIAIQTAIQNLIVALGSGNTAQVVDRTKDVVREIERQEALKASTGRSKDKKDEYATLKDPLRKIIDAVALGQKKQGEQFVLLAQELRRNLKTQKQVKTGKAA